MSVKEVHPDRNKLINREINNQFFKKKEKASQEVFKVSVGEYLYPELHSVPVWPRYLHIKATQSGRSMHVMLHRMNGGSPNVL